MENSFLFDHPGLEKTGNFQMNLLLPHLRPTITHTNIFVRFILRISPAEYMAHRIRTAKQL